MTANTQLKNYTLQGTCSSFGGPFDKGVAPDEGLALFDSSDIAIRRDLFLATQPVNTSGVARRLNPKAYYCATRFDYTLTPKSYLRNIHVQVINVKTGESVFVTPVDWGPNENTGRVIDLSPAVLKTLNLTTNDIVKVVVPLP